MSGSLPTELEDHYTPVEGNWYRCQHSKEDGTLCNTKVYHSEQNPSDLLDHERKHRESDSVNIKNSKSISGSPPESQSEYSATNTGTSDRDTDPSEQEKTVEIVDSSSTSANKIMENTISSIEQGKRIDGRFILRVDSVSTPKNDRKTYELQISDLDGEQCQLDIWKKHDVMTDWSTGDWYLLEELRDSSWTNSNDQTTRRLSSTRNLKVTNLGSNVDTNTTIKCSVKDSNSKNEQTGGSVRNESLFDEIVSEFEDF